MLALLRGIVTLAFLMFLFAVVAVPARAVDAVALRGYGWVRASITPARSEFVCESPAKADILLGKLLADLFWDAGQGGTVTVSKIGSQPVLVHEWAPYGAVVAGRLKNTVVVVGGENRDEALTRASKEPCLLSTDTVFAPLNPYPKFLDFYDLRSVNCSTMGLHYENKFRYQERADFTQKFFKGGLFNWGSAFYSGVPAEGVYPSRSLLDTDIRLAEQYGQLYSMSISTGDWPGWAQDKWPDFVDRSSAIHDIGPEPYLWSPPESLGMTAEQRRVSSLRLLHDDLLRYKDSPSMGAWELYCGDYICETYFSKGYQEHFGYTPVGLDAFRRWLKDVRGLSLADLGARWFGDGKHYKAWDEVVPADPDEFFGSLDPNAYPIRTQWAWKAAPDGQIERPDANGAGWVPVPMPPSMEMVALPRGASFWRTTFDASAWLRRNAGKDVYLVCNVDAQGWRKTNVWLNDTCLGKVQSKIDPYAGPFALKVTGLLTAGSNNLWLQVEHGGNPVGPVFLTTTLPRGYPYFGRLNNARYLDAVQWRLYELNAKETGAMAYARSIDPDHPFVVCATNEEVKDAQGGALGDFGGSMQDTGYESSFRPFNARLGYADGFYGSCEASGIAGINDPATYVASTTRRLSWTLFNGEGMYKEWRDPYCYFDVENKTGWFTKNKRKYDLIGKYLPVKPQIAILHSSTSSLLGYDFHVADWDLGRGELEANHYDNVYVTESMIGKEMVDEYPVLFDTDTMFMDQSTVDAIRKYVERGGTFVALHDTGRHSLLDPDSWPMAQVSGFKVVSTAKRGVIKFESSLPIFKGWEGKQFEGDGSALDFKDTQSAKDTSIGMAQAASGTVALARWDDGSIAVGMRTLGKGRVIVLGSTFWRNGRDLGGTGMWKTAQVEPVFLERLFTDLGAQRTADASTPDVYARSVVTKNGVQQWLIAMNTRTAPTTADVGFAVAAKPDAVWDVVDGTRVNFTYDKGWVRLKNVTIGPSDTRVFGVKRASLAGGLDTWWYEKTRFWTRRAIVPALVETPLKGKVGPPTISFDFWKFFADKDGSVSKAGEWQQLGFNDHTWITADNTPWNLQFPELKDYGGIGLYRAFPFALPADWKSKNVTLNLDGYLGACWSSIDLTLNGQKVDYRRKVDVTDLLKPVGNVLCVRLGGKAPGGDYPLSGLTGCGIWLQPEITLAPSMSLIGQWTAIQGDWATSNPVSVEASDPKLTADAKMKAGIHTVTANHIVRDVELPSAWRGRSVYLRVITPHMDTRVPPVAGLTGGMLIVNGHARNLGGQPNAPLNVTLNLTPDIKFGQANRIELWPKDSAHGSMSELGIVVNDIVIGCSAVEGKRP